jgi:hypothetical protein
MLFLILIALPQDSGDRLSRAAALAEALLKEFRPRAVEEETRQAKVLEETRAAGTP